MDIKFWLMLNRPILIRKKEKKKAIKIKLITEGGSTYVELNQVSNLSYLKTFH